MSVRSRTDDNRSRRDVFVSHASEDKDAIARPLAAALRERGYTVWFDEYELRIGDSLRRRIGGGLRDSRVGVVILSRNFFRKEWPQWELDGLTARQMAGEESILLPIWHEVDRADVMAYSPPLADLVAVRSDAGIDAVMDAISRVVSPEHVDLGSRRSHPKLPQSSARGETGLEVAIGALNVTRGDQSYQDSVPASVDEVVQIQAMYHNRSAERTLRDLTTRLLLPEHAGRELAVSAVLSVDGEAVSAGATVVASLDRAQLRFVPNSINWRRSETFDRASSYCDERLDDATLLGAPIVLGDIAPLESGSVTWQARVIAAVISIRVQHEFHGGWCAATAAVPGQTYPCRVVLRNVGNVLLRRVTVECVGPRRLVMHRSSAQLRRQRHDSSTASPTALSSATTRRGEGIMFDVGNLEVGESAFVYFHVTVDSAASHDQVLHTVATAKAAGMNSYYNTAALNVLAS